MAHLPAIRGGETIGARVCLGGEEHCAHCLLSEESWRLDKLRESDAPRLVTCLCNDKLLPVGVCKRGKKHYFSRRPNTGHLHAGFCAFNSPLVEGVSGATNPAIEWKNGRFQANLDVSFLSMDSEPRESRADASSRRGSCQRKSDLLGLLSFAMNEAQLNRLDPAVGRRSWKGAASALSDVIDCVDVGNSPLRDNAIFLGRDADADVARKLNSICHRPGSKSRRRVMAFGCLSFVDECSSNENVYLFTQGSNFRLAVDRDTWAEAKKHKAYADLDHALRVVAAPDANFRMILIGMAEFEKELTIARIRLVVASPDWIPVQSRYELSVASECARIGLPLTKPIYALAGLGLHPDFIFHTEQGDVFGEVFGVRGNHDYDARAEKKLATYHAIGMSPWIWKASDGGPCPPLPTGG